MAVGIRQTLTQELRQLEQDVRTAECKQAKGIIAETELTRLRTEWNQADRRLRQYDYRHHLARTHSEGDRSGKLLAWLLKNERRPSALTQGQ
ncbi:hypothetical protein NDU88_006866 [Pleurodeles waltl]|uniref:Uncharacterized protein n=1 Tax=Pleurodeles waltl TaxID=8319 RepID=A0AAV7QN05_PLEWA|nr:hypothetical protein NDU88_006866 [Pleurodeles waltl]